jgi:hypothetical protein
MQKGFNSDVAFRGSNYHVQSEDWGLENPFLVSRVFLNGAIVKNIKTSYSEVLKPSAFRDSQAIRLALVEQHQRTLDQLVSGQIV